MPEGLALYDLDTGMHRCERSRGDLERLELGSRAAFHHKDTKVTKGRHEGF